MLSHHKKVEEPTRRLIVGDTCVFLPPAGGIHVLPEVDVFLKTFAMIN